VFGFINLLKKGHSGLVPGREFLVYLNNSLLNKNPKAYRQLVNRVSVLSPKLSSCRQPH